ncbi:MAG TPA: hypothetical protein VMT68_17005 [Caulobacteraceae bacterium]|nr:hypothetical protein [Caulobacteraceae bacterium]
MIDLVRLPVGADPPLADGRICIHPEGGGFMLEIYMNRPRPVIRYIPDLASFDAALLRAQHFARQIGVAAIYAIGCEES